LLTLYHIGDLLPLIPFVQQSLVYILNAGAHVDLAHIETTLNILPGVVIEAVAALFFRQAEQTRERATSLYDRLREDDQATQARGLIHSIEDEKVRSLVKAQVALHMVGLKPKELDLPAISSSNGANN